MIVLFVLAASALQCAEGAPGPSPALPADNRTIAEPRWLQQPSGQDLARLYPEKAVALNVGGRVVMDCVAKADGTLEACKVIEETPQNYGFGKATLRVASRFRMSATGADGRSVAKAHVSVPVTWRLD